jgi:hypothetical protein
MEVKPWIDNQRQQGLTGGTSASGLQGQAIGDSRSSNLAALRDLPHCTHSQAGLSKSVCSFVVRIVIAIVIF